MFLRLYLGLLRGGKKLKTDYDFVESYSVEKCAAHLDVTKTRNGERGTGNGERKSGNELSAETSTKIQNGGPKNEREKEDDKERNSCLG